MYATKEAIIAKEHANGLEPTIFFMDEPMRGLDVGAKAEIRTIITELAQSGTAVLVVSSEIEEIMSVSNRYLVMHRGRITGELPASG
jgi:ABC-type sugar transport system ATPase subunit